MKIRISGLKTCLSGREILHGIDANFPEHGISLLIGSNGSGKSTLIKSIAGILPHSAGKVEFDGTDSAQLSRREIARKCAVLLQNPYAPPEMKVAMLAALGRFPHGGISDHAPEVKQALIDAKISYAADRQLGTLSGGELRKAFLARALAQSGEVLLLDEPEAALDAAAKNDLIRLLKELCRNRKLTVIMAVHDLDFALNSADCICGMKNGEVSFCGAPGIVAAPDNFRALFGMDMDVFHDRRQHLRILPEYD